MNGFDLVSHVFAALPMYMAYVTNQTYLLFFTLCAAVISFVYHLDENKVSLHLDEFASCALIVVTLMTYVNQVYKLTYLALGLLFVVVLIDYLTSIYIVNYYVGTVAFVAVLIFLYERHTIKDMPQRLKVKDAYFVSFLFTQILAVSFFLWDKDPYAHSLWHLFAFVSLASAIAHIHENDEDTKRKVFYILGSIPSRLFISAILIHWKNARDTVPVAVGTLLLALVMLAKPARDMWRGGRDTWTLLHGLSYTVIAVFLFMHNNTFIAGIWLLTDTAVSAYMWYRRADVVPVQPPTYKKLQLQHLRF